MLVDRFVADNMTRRLLYFIILRSLVDVTMMVSARDWIRHFCRLPTQPADEPTAPLLGDSMMASLASLGTMFVRVRDLEKQLPGSSLEGTPSHPVLDLLRSTIIHFGHERKVFSLAEVLRTLVALRAPFRRLGQSEMALLSADQRQNYI
jgi:hypothetical protein